MNNTCIDRSFWRNKKVLITGHSGFKGSWLTLWLSQLEAQVVGVSLPESENDEPFYHMNQRSEVLHDNTDITDLDSLTLIIKNFKPQIVLHLAAQSLVRDSYSKPVDTFSVNIMGTVNVLQAVREVDAVRSLVCVTSDKCYQNKEWVWGYREEDRLGGLDPYSNSKACSELVVQSYRDSFFHDENINVNTGIATARAGNVIGGGDIAKDRLLPDLLRGFNSKQTVSIRNPQSVRPWQHVLEPLSGYLLLAQRLYESPKKYSHAWNFGPDEIGMQTVEKIADLSVASYGQGAGWQNTGGVGNQPHETGLLKLDCSKAKLTLGWNPVWDVKTAVARTIDWDKAYRAGQDMRDYSLTEIEAYEKAAGC